MESKRKFKQKTERGQLSDDFDSFSSTSFWFVQLLLLLLLLCIRLQAMVYTEGQRERESAACV
jgi:hypothetical protein